LKELARGIPNLPKNFLPFPANATFSVQRASLDALAARLNTVLHALDIHWQYRPEFATGIGFAAGNVWSRAARRGKKAKSENGAKSTKPDQDAMDIDDSSEDEEPAFGFKVHVAQKEGRVEVDTRWLQGQDSVLFESLCGMLKRQLAAP
jgi:23S rRNA (adenine1618-N6)-methyltransferase